MDSVTLATIVSCTASLLHIPEPAKLPIIVEHGQRSGYDWETQVILAKPDEHPSTTVRAISEWLFDEAGIYKYPLTYLETIRIENNSYLVEEQFAKQCVGPGWRNFYKTPYTYGGRNHG